MNKPIVDVFSNDLKNNKGNIICFFVLIFLILFMNQNI